MPDVSPENTSALQDAASWTALEAFPLVYEELRKIASLALRREPAGLTLQTTALVNEAFMRLAKTKRMRWHSRGAFCMAAATTIRRVLVDHARGRRRQKRGDGVRPVSIDGLQVAAREPELDILLLSDALDQLAKADARRARLAELRLFGGLSEAEAGASLGLSAHCARKEWRGARAYLAQKLSEAAGDGHP